MGITINQKIVSCAVVKPDTAIQSANTLETVHEQLSRPPVLSGKTYKIKPPDASALYVTITDIVLNEGTPNETRRPFEIFINSKAMEHFQWIVALTRMISAMFRKGGEMAFVVEEMKSVHDPRGGWFHKGRYVPSVVAAIGDVVEQHFIELGLITVDTSLAEAAKAMVAEKMKDNKKGPGTLCPNCGAYAMIQSDGCAVCVECSYSKCG